MCIRDSPIPTPIQKMIDTAQHIKDPKPEGYVDISNTCMVDFRGKKRSILNYISHYHVLWPISFRDEPKKSRPSSRGPSYDIYASLPRSLKSELLVRSKVDEDEEKLKYRQTLIETKTPAELSQIHNLSEVPVPKRIEAWLHGSSGMDQKST